MTKQHSDNIYVQALLIELNTMVDASVIVNAKGAGHKCHCINLELARIVRELTTILTP